MNRLVRTALASVLLVVLGAALVAAADAPVLSREAAGALSDPAFAGRNADGTVAVWVWFTDKGLTGAALEHALDRAEADLDVHARARRAKVRADKSARLVDVTDLPVSPVHLASAGGTGARLRRVSRWLDAASYDATAGQAAALAALPCVRAVTLVRRSVVVGDGTTAAAKLPSAADAPQWSIDYGGNLADLEQIDVPAVHEAGYHGQGVIIGMLDTGFRTTHECLAPLPVLARHDFVNDDDVVENEPGDPSDQDSHGTMTMSTIAGYAPGHHVGPAYGATLVLAKTEDVSQEVPAEEDNWVAGIEWLDTYGVDVVTSSLGYKDWFTFDDLDGNTAACTIAADLAVGKGIVVCNSAGNEGGTSWGHIIAPADGDSVITVGAVNGSGALTYFSSPGPTADGRTKPDVCALGSGDHVAVPGTVDQYTTASGTSFSCPLTAGVAALVLSRAPALTPMQVREAMRETADRAAAPDNDYGWGVLDAYAAVFYYGPSLDHTPLTDTEDTGGEYAVTATITDRFALAPDRLLLHWRIDGGSWQQTALAPTGGDGYAAAIPAQTAGTDVDYWLEAWDVADIATKEPTDAPAAFHSFHVGPDVTPPTIAHTPLGDQPLLTWPPTVSARVTDNQGVDHVEVTWSLDGAPQAPFPLTDRGGGDWDAPFPLDASQVSVGDPVAYSVVAVDVAGTPNTSVDGPHAFTVIDALGVALVVDDTSGGVGDVKIGAGKQPLTAADPAKASAADIARWLREAGYVTYEKAAADVVAADFVGMQFVVLTCGENTTPVASATLRGLLQDWTAGGGKLIVEGGEVGYDALSNPGYPDFATGVLHATDWRADGAGALQALQTTHPLATTPHALPAQIDLTYDSYGDEDAIDPGDGAAVVYQTSSYAGAAGVLAYDDDPAPQAGQVVVFAFNVGAVSDTTVARDLVENAAHWLVADQGAATASISGTVSALSGDVLFTVEGALVSLGPGRETTTGPYGDFTLDGLYAGDYTLTVSKADLSTHVEQITLGEGETLYKDVMLYYTATQSYAQTTPVAIPDATPAGITSVLNVPLHAEVSQITVDISLTHTYVGDLIVELTSPTGTTVRLHDRTGGSADDISGNYEATLVVDGPGALSDFIGEQTYGDWTLSVSDNASIDTGTLNSWGLNITYPLIALAAPDTPAATSRLLPNRPNPFNPRTEIRFELARASRPRLAVFDLLGRKVRTLLSGDPLPAGPHAVVWNGRDDAGRTVASGMYISRLEVGASRLERKMLLAR